ncbi:MAG: radical SAM family heme chaperone HemW [Planctomycetes bacterium]|nr:radical SAM family heme chaperone HemW [Planctomycetota bacterium]
MPQEPLTQSSPTPAAANPPPRDPRTWPAGLYIHLPFCAAICTYCDFASELYSPERPRRYLVALEKELAAKVGRQFQSEIQNSKSKMERYSPRTIFLGGGTPSALSIGELTHFFDMLEKYVDCSKVEEFTIEANPGSTDAQKLEFLLKRGVKRISFGVQSFRPHLLKLLGRIHGADQGREAVALARAAGFRNVSIDLMHGLPTQSRDDLKRDLDEALALGTEHISAYGLIYEDGTPLKGAVEAGKIARLPPEEEAAHYRLVMERMEAGGLPQYEISNYAKPGYEARHNIIYWRNEAYMGVGVSAAGFVNFERATNHYEMDAYMSAVERGEDPAASRERLSPEARARESLVLELRLRAGVDPAEFYARWGLDIEHDSAVRATLDKYRSVGLMEQTAAGRWRITREGLPVADGILSELV